jgi:hypothetical protein
MKGITAVVTHQAQNLWYEFDSKLKVIWRDVDVTHFNGKTIRHFLEKIWSDKAATCWELETEPVAAVATMRPRGSKYIETSTIMVNQPTFNGSTSWKIYHGQSKDVSNHNYWAACQKAKYLSAILQA